MTKYICTSCGYVWFTSATKVEDMVNPHCENCGGELSKAEPKKP